MEERLSLLYVLQIEDVLDFAGGLVVLEDEAAEVEDEIEEIEHVVGHQIVADVFAGLELFMVYADSDLYSFHVFGDEQAYCGVEGYVVFEGGVSVEVNYLGGGEVQDLLHSVFSLFYGYELLVDFVVLLAVDEGADLLLQRQYLLF
jgi:hypothetical protein